MTSPSEMRVLLGLKRLSVLYPYSKVLANPNLVPEKGGIYAWYYKDDPNYVTYGRTKRDGKILMYVGISPRDEYSSQNLFERIQTHCKYSGSSAFRRSLGKHLFGANFLDDPNGDKKLNANMAKNACVCWVKHDKPWKIEKSIIKQVSPLLNIVHNTD